MSKKKRSADKPKRTPDQRTRDRAEIAKLYLQGWYQSDIAEYINDDPERDYTLTQQTISNDIEAIRKGWLNSSIRNFDQARAEELAKIDHLERIYWEAWTQSLEQFNGKKVKSKGHRIEKKGKPDEIKNTPFE
ncbi:MAG: hypothetical protein AAF485_16675, partial [Chloroflexota bacterium]